MDFLLRQRLSVTAEKGLQNIIFKTKDMRIKINDKIYRLKEIESGVDSLMELVEEPRYKNGDFVVNVCEDIPKRKFKSGDKVRIKEGISSRTHRTHNNLDPAFVKEMDDLIGNAMTVDSYTDDNNYVECEGLYWSFLEEWLEPYEGLEKGDLAIFWDFDKTQAVVRLFDNEQSGEFWAPFYVDNTRNWWVNAIKFESKEQLEKLIKGEI